MKCKILFSGKKILSVCLALRVAKVNKPLQCHSKLLADGNHFII